jgi:hypothetical protein
MMAQEEGEILQCWCSSDEATMTLEIPASGGAVTGAYTSSMITEEVSSLFDEDGSSEEYLETRTTNVSVELSGTYSPGDSVPWSLQLAGEGTVDIDNQDDDRFDRSYQGTLGGTATGLFNDDGSLTVGDITAEFTPEQIDAGEIPATRWLDPPPPSMPRELTLSCGTSPSLALSVAPSCTITTIPDPIGPGDTTFQVSITPSGFAAGATLSFAWHVNMMAGVSGQDQNPTVVWPTPTFDQGFYTLVAYVSDGESGAHCMKHWSIGGEQNNPPECQSVGISPPSASAGTTSLDVSAQARDGDGDALTYTFQLMKGTTARTPMHAPGGPRHTLTIPGGLQPGAYTLSAQISDGKQFSHCCYNFNVSGPAQPPGAPSAPVVKGPPIQGPPKPPKPPAAIPRPPAPPPAPPPAEECGPVQVVYLDDLGINMDEAEIDAFIENTLEQGEPGLSLILSHRQALVDRFGQQGFEQIDGLLNDLGSIAETCPFVLIVGDPVVIPFGVLPNPTDDGDVLFTDDVYGDNDHDDLGMPDIPVARIPDGYSLDLLVTQLSPSAVPESGDFTLANSKRPHADGVASQVFGADRVLMWSLPTQHEQVDTSQVGAQHSYFMLHGGSWDTTVWWGEEEVYPEAFTVDEASSQGIVLSGACYGSYTFWRTPDNSITLSFLESGARAFVGSTGITYSPIWTSGPNPTGPMRHDAAFHEAFLSAVAGGQAPLAAFVEAKQEMADLCRQGDSTPAELKMLHEFIYFGKP